MAQGSGSHPGAPPAGESNRSILQRFKWICLLGLLAGSVVSGQPPQDLPLLPVEQHRVLILHSYEPDYPWTVNIQRGIHSVFQASELRIDSETEYLDTKEFDFQELRPLLEEIVYRKYREAHFDAVLIADDNALRLVLESDRRLFATTPLVACGINLERDLILQNRDRVTGVFEEGEPRANNQLIRRLHPDSKHWVGIYDAVEGDGLYNRSEARRTIPLDAPEVELIELFNLSVEELAAELQKLPPDAVILAPAFYRDRLGRLLSPQESFRVITSNTDRPIYVGWDLYIGMGATGGYMTSGFRQGEEAAKKVLQILHGRSVSEVPVLEESPNAAIFDYERLDEAGLSLGNLPAGSIVRNLPVSFYEQYYLEIWLTLAFLLFQSAAIALLLVNVFRRRKAEKDLKVTNQRVSYLLSSTSAVIFALDSKSKDVIFLSENCLEVTGFEAERFLEDPEFWASRVHEDDRLAWRNQRSGPGHFRPAGIEYRFLRADGEFRWILEGLRQEGEDISGYFLDWTERKRMTDNMSQVNKMEAVGRLAGAITHDFNNLLTIVRASADLATEELPKNHTAHELLGEILGATQRGSELTNQLLAFGRPSPDDQEALSLNDRIRSLEPMIRRLLSEDIRLDVQLEKEIGEVRIDPSRFDQIVLNLVVNARDALTSGGKISIETQRQAVPAAGNGDHSAPNTNFALLRVRDSGVGMSKEVADKAFEPFFSTKKKGGGTGLGLATVYGIVTHARGHVTLQSEEGKGTEITVALPCASLS